MLSETFLKYIMHTYMFLKYFQCTRLGKLPLRGSIPDMTADSERYIQLQNVYKQHAEEHVTAVTNHVHDHLHRLGKVSPAPHLRLFA